MGSSTEAPLISLPMLQHSKTQRDAVSLGAQAAHAAAVRTLRSSAKAAAAVRRASGSGARDRRDLGGRRRDRRSGADQRSEHCGAEEHHVAEGGQLARAVASWPMWRVLVGCSAECGWDLDLWV